MRIIKLETIRLPVKMLLIESGGVFSDFNHVPIKIHIDTRMIGLGKVEAYSSSERLGNEAQERIFISHIF